MCSELAKLIEKRRCDGVRKVPIRLNGIHQVLERNGIGVAKAVSIETVTSF